MSRPLFLSHTWQPCSSPAALPGAGSLFQPHPVLWSSAGHAVGAPRILKSGENTRRERKERGGRGRAASRPPARHKALQNCQGATVKGPARALPAWAMRARGRSGYRQGQQEQVAPPTLSPAAPRAALPLHPSCLQACALCNEGCVRLFLASPHQDSGSLRSGHLLCLKLRPQGQPWCLHVTGAS